MPSRDHFVARMREQLRLSDPDLDTSIGTIPRKMIDAVAEMLAEISLDEYLIEYQYDIDSRTGDSLDELVALFGFSRLPAHRATGEVTLERSTSFDRSIVIPVGTQFATDSVPPIVVTTVIPAVMLEGDNIITVPCQAVEAGTAGNITANAIKRTGSPISGIASYTNLVAFTGGTDSESDDALRSRFKRTIFRNLAGTEDQILGVALENEYVEAANVVGPVERHREQIELVDDPITHQNGTAESATSTTLTDTDAVPGPWTVNEFVGFYIVTVSGTGSGQTRTIIANDADTITVDEAWTVTPDNTTGYVVREHNIYGESTIVNAKYVYDPDDYPGIVYFGTDIDSDDIFNPLTTYAVTQTVNPDDTITPVITSTSPDVVGEGIYELDFAYVPRASRNDPDLGITNRVDVWVDGEHVVEATEIARYEEASVFTNTPGDELYLENFRRNVTDEPPEEDNIFIPLNFSPIVDASVNDAIVYNGETYVEGVDYFAVNDITAFGMAPQSLSGIEWVVTANGGNATQPPDQALFSVNYTYNAVPLAVQQSLQSWRQITQDVWVHSSMPILLNFHFVCILNEGANAVQVKADMIPLIRNYLSTVGFSDRVQANDVLAIAHSTPGVDAVRFTRAGDVAGESPLRYGIQRVNGEGEIYADDEFWDVSSGSVKDVFVDDDSTPKLNDIFIVVKAPNTWVGT